MKDMFHEQRHPTTLYCDNTSAIRLALSTGTPKRVKHIDIRHHHIRTCVEDGLLKVEYICTDENIADLLTKSLGKVKHQYFTNQVLTKIDIPKDVTTTDQDTAS